MDKREQKDGATRSRFAPSKKPYADEHTVGAGSEHSRKEMPDTAPRRAVDLQRLAGNRAVGERLARERRSPSPDYRTVQRQRLTLNVPVVWHRRVQTGGQGTGQARTADKVFKGDTLEIGGGALDLGPDVDWLIVVTGPEAPPLEGETAPDQAKWRVRFTKVGNYTIHARGTNATTGENDSSAWTCTVVADLADFQLSCSEALALVNQRFGAASAAISRAANSFDTARKKHEAALADVGESERLRDELLMGALFTVFGGVAGGALGGAMSGLKSRLGEVSAGAYTDAAKDLTKFVVRALPRLTGEASEGSAQPAAQHPDEGPRATGGGVRQGVGEDPFQFLTRASAALAAEASVISGDLRRLISAARQARDANSQAEFGEDPVGLIAGDQDLITYASIPVDERHYLRMLWHKWLETYSWRLRATASKAGIFWTTESNVSGKLRDKINAAASECGDDPATWWEIYERAGVGTAAEAGERNRRRFDVGGWP